MLAVAHGRGGKRMAVFIAAVAGLGCLGVVAAVPAGAQTCDPIYGCPPTTPSTSGPGASCEVDAEVVAAGEVHDAVVNGAPPNAGVDITFDGQVVGTGTTNASGEAVVTFTIPAGTGPGEHTIFAVGAGFSASCGTVIGAAVLGESEAEGPGGAGGDDVRGSSGGAGGGSLARTGMEIGLLLALALVLVLAGQRVVHRARRQRRRSARRVGEAPTLSVRR